MKRFLTLLAFVVATISSYAYDFQEGRFYYNITSEYPKTVEVTYREYQEDPSVYRGTIVIPSEVTHNGTTYTVTGIGDNAFWGCEDVTSVTIPNSVTSIGNWAFYYCDGMESVTLPNSVVSIGNSAFKYCKLKTFAISNNLKSIGEDAFYHSGIKSITIPEKVEHIGNNAFYGCVLNTVNITNLESWYKIKFGNADSNPLKSAHYIHLNGTQINDWEIPSSITSIGDYVLAGAYGLSSFTIPDYVTSIGKGAFTGSDLNSITISNSVTTIDDETFSGCANLTSVSIPNSVTSIGNYVFSACSNLISITIPNSVTSIGDGAFYNCSSLTSITIPNYVTSIGDRTFAMCDNLKSVEIPNSVTSISGYSFWNTDLEDLYCYAENIPTIINKGYFYNTSIDYTTLHVPASVINKYKTSNSEWGSFGNYVSLGAKNITDGEVFNNQLQKEFDELAYTRTFSETLANKWSALYVPFSINVEDYLNDFDIAEIYAVCPSKDTNGDGEINSNDANTLVINKKKTGTTLPNIPYLIRPKEAKTYIITSADNILYPAEENSITCSTTTDVYTFTGHYETTTAVGNKKYYMTTDGILDYSPSSPISIKPNRWLMNVESHGYGNSSAPSEARAISIKVIGEDDETNGIESIKADRNNGNIYNLNGVKMNSENLPAGIYIKNGKKIVVK